LLLATFERPVIYLWPNQPELLNQSRATWAMFKNDLWLVGCWATAGIEDEPGVGELDVAGILWFDYFPDKNSDVEVLRFLQVA
jgi:hypothetical protein